MRRTEAAFFLSGQRLFAESESVYFWTFTFSEVMPDWYYSGTWQKFIGALCRFYGGTLRGLKVVELHKDHGIHYHALLNKRIWVGQVRRLAKQFGMGAVVHVKKADLGAVGYLQKYLSKDFCGANRLHSAVSRWGAIGGFKPCRVRDLEVDSVFHRKMKRAQQLTGLKQLPWEFTSALMANRHCSEEQLQVACQRFVKSGQVLSQIWAAQPAWYSPETEARNREAVKR